MKGHKRKFNVIKDTEQNIKEERGGTRKGEISQRNKTKNRKEINGREEERGCENEREFSRGEKRVILP